MAGIESKSGPFGEEYQHWLEAGESAVVPSQDAAKDSAQKGAGKTPLERHVEALQGDSKADLEALERHQDLLDVEGPEH